VPTNPCSGRHKAEVYFGDTEMLCYELKMIYPKEEPAVTKETKDSAQRNLVNQSVSGVHIVSRKR
jgi:hypothetical protein